MTLPANLKHLNSVEWTGLLGHRTLSLYVSEKGNYFLNLGDWSDSPQSLHWEDSEDGEGYLVNESVHIDDTSWMTRESLKDFDSVLRLKFDLYSGAFEALFGRASVKFKPLEAQAELEGFDLAWIQRE